MTCCLVSETGLLRLQDELPRLRYGSAHTMGRAVSTQGRVCSYNETCSLVSGAGLLIQWDVLPRREVAVFRSHSTPTRDQSVTVHNTGPVTVHQHRTSHSAPTPDQSQWTNTGPVTVHQHRTSQSPYANTGPVSHSTPTPDQSQYTNTGPVSHSTPTRDQSQYTYTGPVTVHQHGTSHSTPTRDQSQYTNTGPDSHSTPTRDQSQYTNTGPVSPSADSLTSGDWQAWFGLCDVPPTCSRISGTGLHRQLYVLPHPDRSRGPNLLSHPVTVY